MYSVNTKDKDIMEAQQCVRQKVLSHEYVLQMHGFYMDKEEKTMRFDIVVSFNAPDTKQLLMMFKMLFQTIRCKLQWIQTLQKSKPYDDEDEKLMLELWLDSLSFTMCCKVTRIATTISSFCF